eukprot:XP_765700.1 adrenodoxin-type ferredoxin [Theileria parva strain Muguga]
MKLLCNIFNNSINKILRPNLYIFHKNFYNHFSTQNIKITFVQYEDEITVSVPVGISILEAAHKHNIEIEGACDGCMACSTCHVILEEDVYDALPEPSETELDMLDLAPCLTNTSRLGCQVILGKEHDNIRITLPRITRNFYVDGHTPTPH